MAEFQFDTEFHAMASGDESDDGSMRILLDDVRTAAATVGGVSNVAVPCPSPAASGGAQPGAPGAAHQRISALLSNNAISRGEEMMDTFFDERERCSYQRFCLFGCAR